MKARHNPHADSNISKWLPDRVIEGVSDPLNYLELQLLIKDIDVGTRNTRYYFLFKTGVDTCK